MASVSKGFTISSHFSLVIVDTTIFSSSCLSKFYALFFNYFISLR